MGSRGVVLRRATRRASRAVRETETTDDTYYPREWYVQKENVELSLYKDVKEWRDVTGKRSPGKALPEDTRRELFWRMEQMMRTQEHHRNEKVGMFFLPYLDWSLREGCKPFLSPTHAHRLYTDLHRTHVEELTRLTAGTPAEAAPLDVLVDATAFDAANALVNFHASMHWNMLFCWKSIVPFGSVDMPVRIRRVIWQYFSENGEDQLREAFEEAAMNHVGNGFVWIVWNRALQLLEVKVTERHQCPKVLDLVPVLGLNLWDNAVAPGYGMNKLEYVKRFWHCIDWTWADYCMGLIQKDSEILHEEGARFSEEKVHRFPTQVSIRDDMLLRNRVRKSRDEPHARIKRDWEAWRTMRIRQDPGVFGPGMHMASHQDQETEFLWKVAQQYHIVHAHCQFSRPPPPTQLASWTMTRRWFNQLQAKHILRKTAVFPPASGILWPEEEDQELVAADVCSAVFRLVCCEPPLGICHRPPPPPPPPLHLHSWMTWKTCRSGTRRSHPARGRRCASDGSTQTLTRRSLTSGGSGLTSPTTSTAFTSASGSRRGRQPGPRQPPAALLLYRPHLMHRPSRLRRRRHRAHAGHAISLGAPIARTETTKKKRKFKKKERK